MSTAKKTTTAKPAAAKKPAAAAKKATPVAAKKPAAVAKKTTATKPAAAAKKTTAPRVDLLGEHIAEVFSKAKKGTFLKVSEIAAAKTKAFPTDAVRPSSQTISGRCRDDRMPEGVTGKTGPRGAVKR